MNVRRSRLLAIPALALAIGMVATGQAQATAPPIVAAPDRQILDEHDKAVDEPGNGLANCPGGAPEASLARMNDLPTTLFEDPNFITLNGSVVKTLHLEMNN